jgi:hypothetical protein
LWDGRVQEKGEEEEDNEDKLVEKGLEEKERSRKKILGI